MKKRTAAIITTVVLAATGVRAQEYGPGYITKQVAEFHRTMANRTTQIDCEKAKADLAAEEEAARRDPAAANEYSNTRNIVAIYCSPKQGMAKAPAFPQQTLPDEE